MSNQDSWLDTQSESSCMFCVVTRRAEIKMYTFHILTKKWRSRKLRGMPGAWWTPTVLDLLRFMACAVRTRRCSRDCQKYLHRTRRLTVPLARLEGKPDLHLGKGVKHHMACSEEEEVLTMKYILQTSELFRSYSNHWQSPVKCHRWTQPRKWWSKYSWGMRCSAG